MYTAVLSAQKNVMQEDNEKLMNQLQEGKYSIGIESKKNRIL
jgi:hypothetical protein